MRPALSKKYNLNYDYYYYWIRLEMQYRMPPQSTEFDFPGVTPSRQKRSRETTAALLQAGADMLRTRSLAELSIEALCTKVGATVGAFYSRFESKEAYFNTLIELAARDSNAMLSRMARNEALKEASLAELCRLLVGGIIGWMRNNEGVLRAALQHDDTRPDRWSRFKGLARASVARATPPLLRVMARPRGREDTRHRRQLSGGAGNAGQRHPQRSRTVIPSRQGDGGSAQQLSFAVA
jgi:AcrR family transcriptional regulator